MADGILSPCNVTRGSGIKILNSPGGSTCNMARGSGMTCHEFAQTSPILEYFWFRFRPLSPQSTCHSAPVCEMLSNSDRPRQKNDVMWNFTIADDTFWFAVILFRSAVHLLSVFVFCRRLLPFTVVFSSSARQPSVVRRQPSSVRLPSSSAVIRPFHIAARLRHRQRFARQLRSSKFLICHVASCAMCCRLLV